MEPVDPQKRAKEIIKSISGNGKTGVDAIIRKAIDEGKRKDYGKGNGKPDLKGLRKEVSDGSL